MVNVHINEVWFQEWSTSGVLTCHVSMTSAKGRSYRWISEVHVPMIVRHSHHKLPYSTPENFRGRFVFHVVRKFTKLVKIISWLSDFPWEQSIVKHSQLWTLVAYYISFFASMYVAPCCRPVPYSRHSPYSRHFVQHLVVFLQGFNDSL